jgi:hypothetical protein
VKKWHFGNFGVIWISESRTKFRSDFAQLQTGKRPLKIFSALKVLSGNRALKTSDFQEKFGISRQAVHRHLAALVREGSVLKLGSSRKTTSYIINRADARRKVLKKGRRFVKRVRAPGLEEDVLLKEVESQPGLLDSLSVDAKRNFGYAFTKMINNAIEHSGTKLIRVCVAADRQANTFTVIDTGVGVFENIREKLGLPGELEAVQDLLKGKQTTMPERHSGEGIFFASKIADRFVLESHRKRVVIDNVREGVFVEDVRFRKGTRVTFEQKVDSKRKLDELFRRYTDERFRFSKSRVTVKLFQGENVDFMIQRSRAEPGFNGGRSL